MINKQSFNLTLDNKVLFSLNSTLTKKRRCSYGELVKECFILFPKDFALTEYPNWPDSLKLDRPLRELRQKGIIIGNPNTYYTLTRLGKELVNKLDINQVVQMSVESQSKSTRSPALKLLDDIEKSDHFKHFMNKDKKFHPSDMRIRGLVRFTLETPNEVVNNFLLHLRDIALVAKRKRVVDFLTLYINFIKKEQV